MSGRAEPFEAIELDIASLWQPGVVVSTHHPVVSASPYPSPPYAHWDGGPSSRDLPASSYAHPLSAGDVQRSRLPAGTPDGPFRVLYAFDGESVGEIINATVHAFLCAALLPIEGGYRLYWGIYVKPISRWTSTYMALIVPFRRYIVYPSVLGGLRREWIRRHGVAA